MERVRESSKLGFKLIILPGLSNIDEKDFPAVKFKRVNTIIDLIAFLGEKMNHGE